MNEIAVLGSAANLCARLSSQAATGEILVSEVSAELAGLQAEGQERRELELKGISEQVPVRVINVLSTDNVSIVRKKSV